MSRFNKLDISTLLDMLADHTRTLTELFVKKQGGPEYENCKQIIQELQSEIEGRKKSTEHLKNPGITTTSN